MKKSFSKKVNLNAAQFKRDKYLFSAEPNTTVVSAEQLNAHYANTSSDPNNMKPYYTSQLFLITR